MNAKYKDTDLREALRRKYADTPKLPENFMRKPPPSLPPRGEEPTPNPIPGLCPPTRSLSRKVGRIKSLPLRGRLEGASYRWRLVGAAACLIFIIGIGFALLHKEEPTKPEQMIAKQTLPKPVPKSETTSSKVRNYQFQSQELSVPMGETATKRVQRKSLQPILAQREKPTPNPSRGGIKSRREMENPSLREGQGWAVGFMHYAAHDSSEDDSNYQDPARVDEFIEKMAAYHNVKEGQLTCGAANDSNTVSRVYVFPDKKEIDVFGRLLQVACWFSDETPGYHLNFSHQQFFFELKDQRRQLQYRWIAERISGRILLYGTHAPIGAETSSTCYQEYRNELMHNSIKIKTKEI